MFSLEADFSRGTVTKKKDIIYMIRNNWVCMVHMLIKTYFKNFKKWNEIRSLHSILKFSISFFS